MWFFIKYLLLILVLLSSFRFVIFCVIYNFADVQFLPISGLMGTNMKTRMDKSTCPWWDGPCLFEALDAIQVPPRDPKGPFR